jgi:hypothetical protein
MPTAITESTTLVHGGPSRRRLSAHVLVIASVPSEALWALNAAALQDPIPNDTTETRWLLNRVRQSKVKIARVAQAVESTKWEKARSRTNAAMHLNK